MGEEGRVGILMAAGCAFVCLLTFMTIVLTQIAMQDRRLVSCADALAGAGAGGASASPLYSGYSGGRVRVDEAVARSRVELAREELSASICRVGEGVSVAWVSVDSSEVEVAVRARPRVSLLPPVLRGAVIPELARTSSARVRGASKAP